MVTKTESHGGQEPRMGRWKGQSVERGRENRIKSS